MKETKIALPVDQVEHFSRLAFSLLTAENEHDPEMSLLSFRVEPADAGKRLTTLQFAERQTEKVLTDTNGETIVFSGETADYSEFFALVKQYEVNF